MLSKITRLVLLATFAIPPFIVAESLYFPFVSGKVLIFRLLVGISFTLWLFLILRTPKQYAIPFKNPVVIATLLFFAALLLTSFLGVDPIHSLFSNIERADGAFQFGFWLLYFLMITSVFKTKRDWQIFLGVFTAVAAILAIESWINFTPRLAGAYNNPSYLAGFMIFAIGGAALFWRMLGKRPSPQQHELQGYERNNYLKKSKKKNYIEKISTGSLANQWWVIVLIFASAILFFLTLIFTQTRAAYVGIVAGFSLFVILSWIWLKKSYPRLVKLSSAIFLLGLLSFGGLIIFADAPLVRDNSILSRIAGVPQIFQSVAGTERLLAWQSAIEAFKAKPIFGWGPENFDIAFNNFYDYNATRVESWFDSSHNQPLDILAEGGLVLFLFYLIWVGAIVFTGVRFLRRGEEFIGAVFLATYLGFLIQGLSLFDTFYAYSGLFPLLGLVVARDELIRRRESDSSHINAAERRFNPVVIYLVGGAATLGMAVWLYFSAWLPYQSNLFAIKFWGSLKVQQTEEALGYLEKAVENEVSFTAFDIRNYSVVRVVELTESGVISRNTPAVNKLYDYTGKIVEEAQAVRPLDPQIYYFGGRLYKLGFKNFGRTEDLAKAEDILRKGRALSAERVEYVNELAEVLIAGGKVEEAEAMVLEHLKQVPPPLDSLIAGHLYFVAEKYDLAAAEYEEARNGGYEFWRKDGDYGRYLLANEEIEKYDRILSVSLEYLEHRGPDALAWFNVAVAYKNLGNEKEARIAYKEAVQLDPQYQEYEEFFKGF